MLVPITEKEKAIDLPSFFWYELFMRLQATHSRPFREYSISYLWARNDSMAQLFKEKEYKNKLAGFYTSFPPASWVFSHITYRQGRIW